MKILFSTLLLTFLLAFTSAQLTTQGKWRPQAQSSPRVHRLPKLDNDQLVSQFKLRKHGGYEFASPVDVVLSNEESGFWSILPSGDKVWSITIESEGAFSLGVTFFKFYMPEEAELYLIGKEEIRGAFTSINNPKTSNHFTIFPVKGSVVTIEYFQPAHVKETPSLNIVKVAHGFRPFDYGDSGRCNINVACDTGKWADQIRSSGMLLSGFGSRFCSGALVNNAANNGDQLFLTAAHCSVDSSDVVLFNYQSASCTNADGPTSNTVAQLSVLARNTNSDFTIVRIGENIPASWNVYLSGISGVNVAPTSMVGIHHPSGDIKKISYADKAGVPDKWSNAEPGNWHWRVPSWDEGTTEPGSSGSPLYDQNQRVVGQLHGGAASCTNIDYDMYGATASSWSLGLATFIDPSNSGATLINGTDLNAVRRF